MTKIEAQTTDEMKIPGAALASTIKVLAGLGSLGERVLKEHGVTKIDNDKEYPSYLRSSIYLLKFIKPYFLVNVILELQQNEKN